MLSVNIALYSYNNLIDVVSCKLIVIEHVIIVEVLSLTVTTTSVSGTSVSLTLSQSSDSLSVYSVVFTSTACPNIESRSASTTTNSLTVDNLEAGVLYSYNVTATNTVNGLMASTTKNITTMETGMFIFIHYALKF